MPTCTNCEKEWTWWQAIKKSVKIKSGMSCPFCGEVQYVSGRAQNKTAAINLIPIALILFVSIFYGINLTTFMFLFPIFLLFFSLYPFWMELTNEEEYFFN